MRLFIKCVAGAVLSGACMLHASAPCRIVGNGPFFLRRIPASAVHHFQAPRIHLRTISEGASTSLNWSGYAVNEPEPGVVTGVSGSWIVPTVTVSGSTDTYSSAWVGIDGYSDDTVEQIGTEQDCTPRGRTVYYAWFEMYPDYAYEIVGFPVAPGDVISAQVEYLGETTSEERSGPFRRPKTVTAEKFQLTITSTNKTTGRVTSYPVPPSYTTVTFSTQLSSAEWIMEAPSSNFGVLPLADFHTVSFADCEATVNGVSGPIGDFPSGGIDAITMETSAGATKAQPSGLTTPATFSVTWEHQ